MRRRVLGACALLAAAAGCTPARPVPPGPPPDADTPGVVEEPVAEARGELPPVPRREGALAIDVVYPAEGAALTTSDSNFVFGSVGTGAASLTIDGAPVRVAPNGAFLAFVPVPRDGVYRLQARVGDQAVAATRTVRVPAASATLPTGALAIVPGSVQPRGVITGVRGERVDVRFRGTPGAQARLVFSDGTSLRLVERTATERAEGFQQDRAAPREFTEYGGSFPIETPLAARDTGVGFPTLVDDEIPREAFVELVRGRDTVRAPLELSLGVLDPGEVRVGIAQGNRPDGTVIGTAIAGSGTPYHWAFPNGTRFTVTGERGGDYRVRLSDAQSVWVDAAEVRLLPPGAPAPAGTVGTVRLVPAPEWVEVRLALSDRLPFEVEMDGTRVIIHVYGVESRTNWLHYGPEDPFVRRAMWEQWSDSHYVVMLDLAEPAWGWRSAWDAGGTLVVHVRKPPRVDAERPLEGLRIGVDAGHPPGGAIGPTRLTEAEANLAIAKHLVRLLREAGAEVLETRPGTEAVELNSRPAMAARANVHLLVSVHNNAFPDGVNPFENAGTSVFYNRPRSLGLARHLQRELLRELGLRDLGIARADLALTRDPWMPSVLTESMFLMVPEQEAALRDPVVQERIARAHLRAIEAFLSDRDRP
ncbi:MAG TPA: N-acetylmuramoyl-L-alanine amidase [Longimicrobiaceae bacterium]|nr:N-acetylmuramoyl-L-alanine amidase [Longimicrobiaceae bacterium]